jgi:uncharacterized protein DUF6894
MSVKWNRFERALRGPAAGFFVDCVMPRYFFRIRNGRYSGASERGIELADHNAAWEELTRSCADMIGGICRKLGQNTQWELELLDESKHPVFRICLVANSLDDNSKTVVKKRPASAERSDETKAVSRRKPARHW